jgi:hypothetical protein
LGRKLSKLILELKASHRVAHDNQKEIADLQARLLILAPLRNALNNPVAIIVIVAHVFNYSVSLTTTMPI